MSTEQLPPLPEPNYRNDGIQCYTVYALQTYARAAIAAYRARQEVEAVFLVATGVTHEGQETYTRHDEAPPPLCDYETLFTHPATDASQAEQAAMYRWLLENHFRTLLMHVFSVSPYNANQWSPEACRDDLWGRIRTAMTKDAALRSEAARGRQVLR